ncbi:MAG: hypothetical protein A2Y33_03960 [Spirochaetes bacterium GWF1_51_8]|nr:MAG: hypothetical protein A2Y33_03960 [Spirochaetes bacterium GWF1_51_8]
MLNDFHFFCTGVIARAAGYPPKDALKIAYASQYLDDATEHKPIHIDKMIFDPARTAYMGIRSMNWAIQKRVFLPFHFLPPKPIRGPEDTFIVEPDSPLSRKILERAASETKRRFRLIRLGIAVHTYADTWAHQGFSGRYHHENCVQRLEPWEDGKWSYSLLKNFFIKFAPHIGHAEAGLYPDISYLKWRFYRKHERTVIVRSNPDSYLDAAKMIYSFFRATLPKDVKPYAEWKEIAGKVFRLLSSHEPDLDKRCELWADEFRDWFLPEDFAYDKFLWRSKALLSKKEIQKGRRQAVDFDTYGYGATFELKRKFYKSDWVLFHRAALKQRHFVLENLL